METAAKSKLDKLRNQWQSKIEELELQLTLGKAEAFDKFEDKKKNFQKSINELKSKTGQFDHLSKEKATALKSRLEELHVQLNLGKAETKEIFEEQKHKIDKSMSQVKNAIEDFREDAGETFEETRTEFEESVEDFKTKLETFKLHYALGKAELKDELENRRKDLQSSVNELKQKIHQIDESSEAKWDEFKSEMADSFSHAKKAFEGLLR